MGLKLITEVANAKSVIVEAKVEGHKPEYYIEGIFMQGDLKNQNGRVYPTQILAREAERYTKDFINRKRAFGELGHPDSPTINLDRASHMITDLTQEGTDFIGKAKVLIHTPMGNIVKALIDEGAELGVSSRGLGSLTETSDGSTVGDDFYFATVDVVADPSAPDAFVRGIMEGKSWVWESGTLKECQLAQIAEKIDAAHAPTVPSAVRTQTLVEGFAQFLAGLRVKSTIR